MKYYVLIEKDSNLKPFKMVSVHKTLKVAKKKLQTYKPNRLSKGVDIVVV